ncbi:MAG: lytic transglycosylase domain-containing protein [Gammaproteobacteria bacterium]|nr:lytic transglycosylase domain-containing protein [Gammaproteobacteria bacterium]
MTIQQSLLITGLFFLSFLHCEASAQAVDAELKILLKQAIAESSMYQDRYEAEVWYTDMNTRLRKRVKDNSERINLLNMIHAEARRANLQPELVMAVIQIESNFDRWAISRVGARGLMQVMPFWLKEIGRPGDDLFNAKTNLRMGCTILRHYLDKENGNLIKALGRYNGSLGSYRYPRKVLTALRKNWYRP